MDRPDAPPNLPTDPLERVPPEALAGDAAACPRGFVPEPGANEGFGAGGQQRPFSLWLPGGATGPRPLFVAFNGTGEDGDSFFERAELDDFVDRGFIVAAPDSNANGSLWPVWDAGHLPGAPAAANPDLALFDALLACLAANLEIDRHRIYVGGHSAGGGFTNHVLRSRPEVVAGGIVASGIFSYTDRKSVV